MTQIPVSVYLITKNEESRIGRAVRSEQPNNGVRLFEDGGRFRLRISSTLADWQVRIQQVTPEEAEAYTPKPKGPILWPQR